MLARSLASVRLPGLRNIAAVVIPFLSLLWSTSAAALDPEKAPTQYGLRAWGTAEGLPQGSIQTIAQTGDGYLWLGTQDGIARFDGARFEVFDPKNTPGLRSGNVFRLLEDREGNLWVATGGGGLSRLSDGKVTSFGVSDGLPNDLVHTLHQDRAGNVWVGTAGGLGRLRDGVFQPFRGSESLAGDRIWAILEDFEGSLWIGTDRGLARLHDGKIERFTGQDGLSNDHIRSLHEGADKTLWIGTAGGGLNFRRNGRFEAHPSDLREAQTVLAITTDRHGTLWLGTKDGLVRLSNGKFTKFANGGLAREQVWSVLEDEEGSLWVGTLHGGLFQLIDQEITNLTTAEGLAHDVAWSVLEDGDGTLWVGTGGGGLTRFADGRLRSFTTKDGLPNDSVYSLWKDRTGVLWIGTLDGGLSRLDKERITSAPPELVRAGAPVRAMYEDREDAMWFGREAGGLVRWKNGRATTFTKADGLSNESVFALEGDAEGNLWIGTFGGGLIRYRDGEFTSYGKQDGLSNHVVLSLHSGADGTLWIGTNGGGLNRFRDGEFTAYTTADGLFDDVVFQILEDRSGRLWMSSNRGIFAVSLEEVAELDAGRRDLLTSPSYGESDGMRSHECNGGQHPAGWRGGDGTMYFPTIAGVAVFNPDHERTARPVPRVRLERVLVDGVAVPFDSGVELSPSAKRLEISFTAPTFISPGKIEFKHRLVGFDDDWVRIGTRRTAHYTNLRPGRYRFAVAASNGGDEWNETGASFAIVRKPRIHEKKSFFLFSFSLGVLGVIGVHRLRVRHLNRRERELADLVTERTGQLAETNAALESEARAARSLAEARASLLAELETKNEDLAAFSYSVSHDLRAPLRAIDGFSRALHEEHSSNLPPEGLKHLGDVRESARQMSELIDGLLMLSRIGRGTLQWEPVDLSALAREIADRLARSQPERKVEFVIEDGMKGDGDRRLLAIAMENLIGNAWKFTGKRDWARIEVGQATRDGRTTYFVRDNGSGFDLEYSDKLFGVFQRLHSQAEFEGTGIGLATCKRVVRRHGGRIWAEAGKDRGATFYFTLSDPAGPGDAALREGT